MKYTQSLAKLGLTPDQAHIYETLLGVTMLPVRLIALNAKVGRELTYIVLKQLEQIGLVERIEDGKIIFYKAVHPSAIGRLIEQQQEQVRAAEKSYKDILADMVGDFNIAHHKPYIRFYEGLSGLQKTYDHILKHAKKVQVIRSLYDYENPAIRDMVVRQLEKQAAHNIRSYVISPKLPHMRAEPLTHNMKRNITRKTVPKEKLDLPAQVLIYNNTVSITSMKGESVTTIIENKDIAATFRTLFEYMWEKED